jgi:hypothetical protein
MYLEMATEEDKKMAENWKADADDILIFVRLSLLISSFTPTQWSQTGLFSAAVASLISVSIQDLRQNPQDTSNFFVSSTSKGSAIESLTTAVLFPLKHPFQPLPKWLTASSPLSLIHVLPCVLLRSVVGRTSLQNLTREFYLGPRYVPPHHAKSTFPLGGSCRLLLM